ncbi:MAG: preprotein translocase subunit Sec61beta [Methanosphaera sp.]|nr:preprotein translocase subunit Sec61beta [Methanosphaera sp.]
MAKDNKRTLPASGAGIVRYFNDDTSGIKLSPNQVVIGCIIIAILCIALRFTTSGS